MKNLISLNMGSATSTYKRKLSKGDRLNWTPVKDVQPIKLNSSIIKGKKLTSSDLSERNNNSHSILIP